MHVLVRAQFLYFGRLVLLVELRVLLSQPLYAFLLVLLVVALVVNGYVVNYNKIKE